MTFIFRGKTKLDIKRRYKVVFKARSLTQRGGQSGFGDKPSDDVYSFQNPSYPYDGLASLEKRDWLFVYGLGLGINFILDNSDDQGKTSGGTGSPGLPGQIPGAGKKPSYPKPPNYTDFIYEHHPPYAGSGPGIWRWGVLTWTYVGYTDNQGNQSWTPQLVSAGYTPWHTIIADHLYQW